MSQIAPLHHTGDSSNIAYYGQQLRQVPGTWAEVLRSDFDFTGKHAYLLRVPRFHFTVYQDGNRKVAEFSYQPKTNPGTGPLSDRTVTRLVREALTQKESAR